MSRVGEDGVIVVPQRRPCRHLQIPAAGNGQARVRSDDLTYFQIQPRRCRSDILASLVPGELKYNLSGTYWAPGFYLRWLAWINLFSRPSASSPKFTILGELAGKRATRSSCGSRNIFMLRG